MGRNINELCGQPSAGAHRGLVNGCHTWGLNHSIVLCPADVALIPSGGPHIFLIKFDQCSEMYFNSPEPPCRSPTR